MILDATFSLLTAYDRVALYLLCFFTMTLDLFSQIMDQVVALHNYNPLRANHNHISHLIFADDLLIMSKVDQLIHSSINSYLSY